MAWKTPSVRIPAMSTKISQPLNARAFYINLGIPFDGLRRHSGRKRQ
jgi:hypothetical protein